MKVRDLIGSLTRPSETEPPQYIADYRAVRRLLDGDHEVNVSSRIIDRVRQMSPLRREINFVTVRDRRDHRIAAEEELEALAYYAGVNRTRPAGKVLFWPLVAATHFESAAPALARQI